MNHRIVAATAAGALALGVAACGVGPDQSREDAADVVSVDKSPPEVRSFNNHYPNVEFKCDGHGHRLFVTTHDSSKGQNFIVLPDPTCPGFVQGQEPAVVATH